MRTFTTLEAVQSTRRRVITLGGSPKKSPTKEASAPEHQVAFKNAQSGKHLAGTLTQALEGSKLKQAVVLAHGFASHRDGFHLPAIAQACAKKGVSSLRIDFAGNGDSEGTFQFGNYAEEAHDLRAAVQFLRAKGFEVTGIVGHSKGGNSALLYAATFDDVPNIVNIAGRFDLRRGITERFGNDIAARLARDKQIAVDDTRDDGTPIAWHLTKWSYQDRVSTDMTAACKKIRCADVLTIHGTKDRVTPAEDARQWGAHIAHHRLQLVEGADHSFLMPGFSQQMIDAVVAQCAL